MGIKNIFSMFKDRPRRLLGIDVGKHFVRSVELSCHHGRCQLEACSNIVLLDQGWSKHDYEVEVRKALQGLLINTKYVAVSMPYGSTVFKEFLLDKNLKLKDVDKFLRFRLSKDLSIAKGEIIYDYQVVEDLAGVKIQLVAVPQVDVDNYSKLIGGVGFLPKIIDVDVYAIERAVRFQFNDIVDLMVIINIDHDRLLLMVIDDEKILYTKEVAIGLGDMTKLDELVKQLNKEIHLAMSVLTKPFSQVVLAGEVGVLPGLSPLISSRFNLPVEIVQPFAGISLAEGLSKSQISNISPLMLVAYGLALRVLDED